MLYYTIISLNLSKLYMLKMANIVKIVFALLS